MSNPKTYETVYLVVTRVDDGEGIMAYCDAENGLVTPMIASNDEVLRRHLRIARQRATKTFRSFRVWKYTERVDATAEAMRLIDHEGPISFES